VILLDTQSLLWVDELSPKVGSKSRQMIAEQDLGTSAISFWEVAMLVEKGRVDLSGKKPMRWRTEVLQT